MHLEGDRFSIETSGEDFTEEEEEPGNESGKKRRLQESGRWLIKRKKTERRAGQKGSKKPKMWLPTRGDDRLRKKKGQKGKENDHGRIRLTRGRYSKSWQTTAKDVRLTGGGPERGMAPLKN